MPLPRSLIPKVIHSVLTIGDAGRRYGERPELRATIDYYREGDEFVAWKLDQFGRSLQGLLEMVNELKGRGV